jgi:mono/diheme cytochrome c family protein
MLRLVKTVGCLLLMCALVTAITARVGLSQSGTATNSAGKAPKNPVKSSPQSIEAGQKAYQTSCAPCHGAAGKGDGAVAKNLAVKPSDLTDPKWEHGSTDGEIFVNIRDGIGPQMKMKAFKGKVSDQDIWNIVNYLRSIGSKK